MSGICWGDDSKDTDIASLQTPGKVVYSTGSIGGDIATSHAWCGFLEIGILYC